MSTEQDGLERTEAPSPRWVAQVRERGAWPSSRELVTACAVLSGLLTLRYAGPSLLASLCTLFAHSLGTRAGLTKAGDMAEARGWVLANSWKFVPFLLPPFFVTMLVGLTQTGGRFRFELLRPRFERFNGIRVFQQITGGSTAKAAVFASLKFTSLLVFVAWSLASEVTRLGGQVSLSPSPMTCYAYIPWRVMTGLAFLLVGFGLIDYAWAWVRHMGQMRMTRAELAADLRELEGDPVNRRRMRQKRINGSHVNWERLLRSGDMLLLGSGRLALTIRFQEESRATLIAKVVGTLADSMERVAQGRGGIVVRHVGLARKIVDRGEVGKELPAELVDQLMRIRSRPPEKVVALN
jgi:flagellar biosynthesis protein FlhB